MKPAQGASKKWGIALAVAGAVTFIAVYFSFNPLHSAYFPRCPFHSLTGYDCPGCGSQRAIHYLLHLDIANAFKANAMLVSAIPYIMAGIYFEYFGGKERYPHIRRTLFGARASILIFITVMIFWVGRNIIS